MNHEILNLLPAYDADPGAGLRWGWGKQPAFLCQYRGRDMSVVVLPIKEQAELVTPLVGPYVQLEQDTVVERLMCCLIKCRTANSDVLALFFFL